MLNKKSYYFPQLDSIRGLSFLAVYFLHAFHPHFGDSFPGRMAQYLYNELELSIDVFFILSSFLLTWLGINEYKVKGNFSFINYFIRRALRIWPLYFLLMLFSFLLLPYVAGLLHIPVTLPPAYYYVFFISNFYLEGHVYFLRFLWTLSVEEQFYLLWGICLLLFQRELVVCVTVLTLVSVVFTVYAMRENIPGYFNTLTYLFDFAIGILAAVILHRNNWLVLFFKNISRKGSVLFALVLPVLFLVLFLLNELLPPVYGSWIDLAGRYIFIIYIGLFIIEQMVNEHPLIKLMANRFLVYTGKISYGLYCFHGIVLTLGIAAMQKAGIIMPAIIEAILLLSVNFLVASLSYRFVEKPFLNWKNKLRRV